MAEAKGLRKAWMASYLSGPERERVNAVRQRRREEEERTIVLVHLVAPEDHECRNLVDSESCHRLLADLGLARGVEIDRLVKVGRQGFVEGSDEGGRGKEEGDGLLGGLRECGS